MVDASVARAAGGTEAKAQVARACRDALHAMRDAGLGLYLSPQIRGEWDTHMSRFARTWLLSMTARKRVERGTPPPHAAIRRALRRKQRDGSTLAAVEKDLPLIDAALASERRVLSLDDRAQRQFAALARTVRALREVHWAGPHQDGCVEWIRGGAQNDHRWHLA